MNRKRGAHSIPAPSSTSGPVNLQLGYNVVDQLVLISFKASITSIAFTPNQAEDFARGLVEHARAARGKAAS